MAAETETGTETRPFRPALIVVDFQEDFCPPNGSLAVPQGRSIAHPINTLLSLPFSLKLATRDAHPPNHISFAANHQTTTASSSSPAPFTSSTTITHPDDPSRSYTTTLWPVHCVVDSPGANLVPELDAQRLHAVIDKGTHSRLEMYSAFYDPFHLEDTGLAAKLASEKVTDVFVVGLAADYCVRATAEHAVEEGYRTFIVEECTKAVIPDKWAQCRAGLVAKGVVMTSMDGDDVARVQALST